MESVLEAWLSLLPDSVLNFIQRLSATASRKKNSQLTWLIRRPRDLSKYALDPIDGVLHGPEFAVVMQGPLVLQDEYTEQTLALYRRLHPEIKLILSTWKGESQNVLNRLAQLGIHVVQSDPPAQRGMWNLNLQIISTMAGLRVAKSLGCSFAVKTRTDQRMLRPDFPSTFLGLAEAFSLKSTGIQNGRIQVASMNSYRFRPYSLSDMLVAGALQDLIVYWDLPLNDERRTPADYSGITLDRFIELRSPEYLLVENYSRRIGRNILNTLEDYHDLVKDSFLIIDQEMLDLTWAKSAWSLEYQDRNYLQKTASENWTFSSWIALRDRPISAAVKCSLLETKIDGEIIAG